MQFDYAKLRGRITEKVGSQEKLAEIVGLTPQALSRKLSGEIRFSAPDIVQIVDVLEIPKAEVWAYFFNKKV